MEQVSGFWVKNGQKWTGNAISAPPETKREAPVSASLSINNYYLLSLAIGRSLADTEVDEDIYLENTYLLTSLTSASYVG